MPRPPRPRSATRSQRLSETPGPDPTTPVAAARLTIGYVIGGHGVAGELKIRLTTDDPEYLPRIKRVYLGDEATPRRALGVRLHPDGALLTLKGVASREAADTYRGQAVRISGRDARPLAPDEFYFYQLIGLDVQDEAGQLLGTVTDIIETGANDVFVVTPPDGGRDQLFPHHPDVVLRVDPAARRMTVRPLVYLE